MKTTKIISTMCAVLIALVMSACGETSQSRTDSNAEVETTTTTAPATETETTTTTTALSDEPKNEERTTTKKEIAIAKPVLKTGFDEATNIVVKNGGLIYNIPSYYQKKSTDENGITYTYEESDGSSEVGIYFSYFPYDENYKFNEEYAQIIFDSVKEKIKLDDDYSSTKIEQFSFLGRTTYGILYTNIDLENNYSARAYMFLIHNKEAYTLNYILSTSMIFDDGRFDYDYSADINSILNSIEEDKDYVYEKPTDDKKDETSKSDESKNTYEHNSYYDIVESASWTDIIGSTHIVHKVKAKQDVSISASILAYSESGSVIGKSSSDIVLTKGQTNYFEYYFDEDVSNAQLKPSFKAKEDSFIVGERNGVELVEYSITDENLYLTLKQNVDDLGLSKYKILLYNGDQIVGTKEGFYSISAENLDGKGSTDVAEIWTYGTAYDRIEFIYEP